MQDQSHGHDAPNARVRIPNRETATIWTNFIKTIAEEMLNTSAATRLLGESLHQALVNGEVVTVQKLINVALLNLSSLTLNSEAVYHVFLFAILSFCQPGGNAWDYYSEQEAGLGRVDILAIKRMGNEALILELKTVRAREVSHLGRLPYLALAQIDKRRYFDAKVLDDWNVRSVREYGIGFAGKECLVAGRWRQRDSQTDEWRVSSPIPGGPEIPCESVPRANGRSAW